MQIDVDVNMTLEVDDDAFASEFESYKEYENEDATEEDFVQFLADDALGSGAITTVYGEAWVCSVDNATAL